MTGNILGSIIQSIKRKKPIKLMGGTGIKYELGKFLRKLGGDLAKEEIATEEAVIVQLASLSQREALSDGERCAYTK